VQYSTLQSLRAVAKFHWNFLLTSSLDINVLMEDVTILAVSEETVIGLLAALLVQETLPLLGKALDKNIPSLLEVFLRQGQAKDRTLQQQARQALHALGNACSPGKLLNAAVQAWRKSNNKADLGVLLARVSAKVTKAFDEHYENYGLLVEIIGEMVVNGSSVVRRSGKKILYKLLDSPLISLKALQAKAGALNGPAQVLFEEHIEEFFRIQSLADTHFRREVREQSFELVDRFRVVKEKR